MLQILDRYYLPLARREYDRELSLTLLAATVPSYERPEIERFDQLIAQLERDHTDKLREIYAEHEEDQRNDLLVFQPAALAVFERLEHAPVRLRERWGEALPPELLDELANTWGTVIARPGEPE